MGSFRHIGVVLLLSLLLSTLPCWARVWDVTELGARGNKETNDTAALQKAIDSASQAGGGTVYVPAGDYRCGQLQLRSHVTLHLEAGATLWVSADKADYQRGNTFLLAQDQNDVAIEGRGTIQGTGAEDLQRKRGDKRPRPDWRVGILRFTACTSVAIREVAIRYSDSWTLDLERCDDVLIDGVRIWNNYYRVNADGIDPVSCRRVRISNCSIVAGDDCIVCKTRAGHPCEDIVVTNCVLESIATAVKIGTESPSDFRNILVSNCVIRNSTIGLGLFIKDGGTAERISFSHCTIETIRQPELAGESLKDSIYPIFVDIEKRQADSRTGKVRDLSFSDISILSDNGILMQGMTTGRIENVSLRNITMRVDRAADYAKRKKHVGGKTEPTEDRRETIYARQSSYITLANIDGLTVSGLRVLIPNEVFTKYNRSALSLQSVSKAILSDIRREPFGADSNIPVVAMGDCRNTLLTGCLAQPNTGVFLGLAGERTASVSFQANESRESRKVNSVSEAKPPTDGPSDPWIGQVITGIATVVMAFAAGFTALYARRQHKLDMNRVKTELYGRRLKVYRAITNFVKDAGITNQPDGTRISRWYLANRHAGFLFPRDAHVTEYVYEFYKKRERQRWIESRIQNDQTPDAQRTKLVDEQSEIRKWFEEQSKVIDERFRPYLQLVEGRRRIGWTYLRDFFGRTRNSRDS